MEKVKKAILGIVMLGGSLLVFIPSVKAAPPAFPINFKATSKSACTIELLWDQPAPGAYYYAYIESIDNFGADRRRSEIPGSPRYFPSAPVTGPLTKEIKGKIEKQPYWFQIQACNQNNECSLFDAQRTTTVTTKSLPAKPEAPEIVKIEAKRSSLFPDRQDVKIEWQNNATISTYGGFVIYVSKNGGSLQYVGRLLLDDPNRPLIYADNGRELGANYAYSIKAFDSAEGCVADPARDPSYDILNPNQIVFSDMSGTVVVPEHPDLVSGRLKEKTPPIVEITWDDKSASETKFEIYRSTQNSFPEGNTDLFVTGLNLESYIDSSVQTGTTYYYKVRACNDKACSIFGPTAYPEYVEVVTGMEAPVLEARMMYASVADEKAKVRLSWPGVVGVSYLLERSTASDMTNPVKTPLSNGSSFYIEDAPFYEKYYYRLKATQGAFEAFSNITTVNARILFVLRGTGWTASGKSNALSRFIQYVKAAVTGGKHGPGWIKFNSEGAAVKYSVQVDQDGLLSGLARTSKYGWLSFNKEDMKNDCPPGKGSCEAVMNKQTGAMSGWARFLTPKVYGISNSGWDGWVSLSGDAVDGTPYGARYDSPVKKIVGAAWGGDIVGWVAFGSDKCPLCNVTVDSLKGNVPSATNVMIDNELCDASPYYRVRWQFQDLDPTDTQQAANVQFVKVSNGQVDFADSVGTDQTYALTDPLTKLSKNETYRVRVQVSDGTNWSAWGESSNANVANHYPPLVDFSWSPPADEGSLILFSSAGTQDRTGGVFPIDSYNWTFTKASPTQTPDPNPAVTFSELPAEATLTVTDTSGVSCTAQKDVEKGTENAPLKRKIYREK